MKWSAALFTFTVLALIGLTIFEKSRVLGLTGYYPPPKPELLKKQPPGPMYDLSSDFEFSITTDTRPFFLQVGFTVAVGITALILLLSRKRQPKDKYWAYATLGTLVGYWLRGGYGSW